MIYSHALFAQFTSVIFLYSKLYARIEKKTKNIYKKLIINSLIVPEIRDSIYI